MLIFDKVKAYQKIVPVFWGHQVDLVLYTSEKIRAFFYDSDWIFCGKLLFLFFLFFFYRHVGLAHLSVDQQTTCLMRHLYRLIVRIQAVLAIQS